MRPAGSPSQATGTGPAVDPVDPGDGASLHPRLQLHGVAQLWPAGQRRTALVLESRHAALLAWLHLEGPTPRGRLAGLLWPAAGEARARGNLRQRLLKLRQLAGDVVIDQRDLLALHPAVQLLPPPTPTARLLASHPLEDCEALASWLQGQRELQARQRRSQWLQTVQQAAQSQQLDDALQAADQLLALDEESEEAYRALMEVYYLRGDHAAALASFDRCREMLRQTYGVPPSPATLTLGQTLLEAARTSQARPAPAGPGLPVTVLRPPQLLGREAQLGMARTAWSAGGAVWVEGEAGIGKTRLLAALAGSVDSGARASARLGDAVRPFAVLLRLLHALRQQWPGAFSAAAHVSLARLEGPLQAGGAPGPIRNEHQLRQLLRPLQQALAAAAGQGCRHLLLDDLHWADSGSLDAIALLQQPAAVELAGHLPMPSWALAWRDDEVPVSLRAAAGALRHALPGLVVLKLPPLQLADTQALVESLHLPDIDAAGLGARLHRRVGGNPAFILESVKLLLTQGPAADGQPPWPPSAAQVLRQRLTLLSPAARHLAELAAVAGPDFTLPLAAQALACPAWQLGDALRELEERQVLGGRQFTHELLAQALREGLPAAAAEFMHRCVAEHLQAEGADAADIARHWLAAGQPRAAGRAWLLAAQRAQHLGRLDVQGLCLDAAIAALQQAPAAEDELFEALLQALQAMEVPGYRDQAPARRRQLAALARSERQRLQVLQEQVGANSGATLALDEATVRRAVRRAIALGDMALAHGLAAPLAWYLAQQGRGPAAVGLLRPMQRWADGPVSPAERAEVYRGLAGMYGFMDLLEAAMACSAQADAAAHAAGLDSLRLPVLTNWGLFHHWRGEFDAALLRLRQAQQLREALHGSADGAAVILDVQVGAVLRDLGQYDAAARLLDQAAAVLAAAPPAPTLATDQVFVDNNRADLALRRGDPALAAMLLGTDTSGAASRFVLRRRCLQLRWERLHGGSPSPRMEALVAQVAALCAAEAAPFQRVLAELELAAALPPGEAAPRYEALHAASPMAQRPGLRLHAALAAAAAWRAAGQPGRAAGWARRARRLQAGALGIRPFDLHLTEPASQPDSALPIGTTGSRRARSG